MAPHPIAIGSATESDDSAWQLAPGKLYAAPFKSWALQPLLGPGDPCWPASLTGEHGIGEGDHSLQDGLELLGPRWTAVTIFSAWTMWIG